MSNRAIAKNINAGNDTNVYGKEKTRSGKNRVGFNDKAMPDIETLLADKKWKQAQQWLQQELLSAPTDHWLWFTLSLAYYEQKQYDFALKCAKRAVELQPDCPLALWHYAGSLYMTGHESAALAIWLLIREMELEKVAYEECGEGMDWAMRLVNDVHYRIGRYYQRQGKTQLASESFEKYLANRDRGVESSYDAAPIRRYLESVHAVS